MFAFDYRKVLVRRDIRGYFRCDSNIVGTFLIEQNNITFIPSEIGLMSNLRRLYLGKFNLLFV